MEFLLKGFLKTQKESIDSYEKRLDEVLKKIKKSRWTPKWEVALLYIVISINTIAFGYLGYYFINYDLKMKDAVRKARQEGFGKARGYFKDHKVIYKDFKRWEKKKDSVSNLR